MGAKFWKGELLGGEILEGAVTDSLGSEAMIFGNDFFGLELGLPSPAALKPRSTALPRPNWA
jgi:hypothetical protein